ncbi:MULTISPECIES: deoxyribodipyrimidine photo-lyase [Pseudomonas]|uniref:deoxyribodipyrimidine photo-lyase n=1 Tax=Pseudomonas TaxID=286 RepID=UPI00257DCCCF|nr:MULTISPECIES: deoxyribodipyrimidine photo-lyase [Pseudomonas]
MSQLIWFRSDLRAQDNSALHAALGAGPTIAVYLIAPGQWRRHDDADCKVDFWLRNLAELRGALGALNVPLLIRQADDWSAAPRLLAALCREHEIRAVQVNDEYGVNESARDAAVEQALKADGVAFRRHLDQLFFAPGSVLTQSDGYFKVYGQFRKQCLQRLHAALPHCLPAPRAQAPMKLASDSLPKTVEGFATPSRSLIELWPAGERAARKRLDAFADEDIGDYHVERDFPAQPGTSRIGAYLSAGVVSPRQCLHAALASNGGEFDSGNPGVTTWIDELLWREFYKHILVGYPRVSMHRAFKPETERLPWRQAPADLEAWQQGRTGIPIVDAAMRQMLGCGWMHNRLRMISAMFLSKNLLIDWREGERWFMRHLIDGDLAANNGGWQWSASTGTDSVPYFRIFNAVSQSQKFDPHGDFIREWVPELAGIKGKQIHSPGAKGGDLFGRAEYPAPIVDLGESRQRALAAFRNLR